MAAGARLAGVRTPGARPAGGIARRVVEPPRESVGADRREGRGSRPPGRSRRGMRPPWRSGSAGACGRRGSQSQPPWRGRRASGLHGASARCSGTGAFGMQRVTSGGREEPVNELAGEARGRCRGVRGACRAACGICCIGKKRVTLEETRKKSSITTKKNKTKITFSCDNCSGRSASTPCDLRCHSPTTTREVKTESNTISARIFAFLQSLSRTAHPHPCLCHQRRR